MQQMTCANFQDFQTYLTFCAIGLINAQLLDQSFSLSRRLQVSYSLCIISAIALNVYLMPNMLCLVLQVLLQLTQGLFEDTTCLEVVMKKVMTQSLELIPCHRCSVLLVDDDSKEVSLRLKLWYYKCLIMILLQEVKFSRAFQVDHPTLMGQSVTSVKYVCPSTTLIYSVIEKLFSCKLDPMISKLLLTWELLHKWQRREWYASYSHANLYYTHTLYIYTANDCYPQAIGWKHTVHILIGELNTVIQVQCTQCIPIQLDKDTDSLLCLPIFNKDGHTIGELFVTEILLCLAHDALSLSQRNRKAGQQIIRPSIQPVGQRHF